MVMTYRFCRCCALSLDLGRYRWSIWLLSSVVQLHVSIREIDVVQFLLASILPAKKQTKKKNERLLRLIYKRRTMGGGAERFFVSRITISVEGVTIRCKRSPKNIIPGPLDRTQRTKSQSPKQFRGERRPRSAKCCKPHRRRGEISSAAVWKIRSARGHFTIGLLQRAPFTSNTRTTTSIRFTIIDLG